MTVSTWNINGWTNSNKSLRQAILISLNYDIYCINETHLKFDDVIDVQGYCWYGHNRSSVHVRAPKGSGGTGILIKNYLFDIFYIEIIDKTFDGVIGIQLIEKISSYTLVILSCYVPPENSPYATNVNEIFAHLTSLS